MIVRAGKLIYLDILISVRIYVVLGTHELLLKKCSFYMISQIIDLKWLFSKKEKRKWNNELSLKLKLYRF